LLITTWTSILGMSFMRGHVVIVEIGLDDAAAVDGDGVFGHCGERVDGGAFYLSDDAGRIDWAAAIDGVNDAMDLDLALLDAHLGNRRGVRLEGKISGDAAANALRQWLSPLGFFGGEPKYSLEPRRIERLVFFWVGEVGNFAVGADQLQTEFQGIDACCCGEFVGERFDYKAAAGMFDGTPPSARDAGMRQRVLDTEIRRVIGNECGGGKLAGLGLFLAVLVPDSSDGRGALKMFPGGDFALRVHRSLHFVVRGGAIEIVLHVVFAGPENLHGLAGDFRYLRGFHDKIGLVATAEAATHQRGVDVHLFQGKPRDFGDDFLRPLRSLCGHPGFRAIGANVHGAIHGFHAGVGSEG